MPRSHLTKKGQKVKGGFTKRYGSRGSQVFYATMNKNGVRGGKKGAKALFKKGSTMRKPKGR